MPRPAIRPLAYSGGGRSGPHYAPPPGQRLEVRVWSPGGQAVSVYRAGLTRQVATPAA